MTDRHSLLVPFVAGTLAAGAFWGGAAYGRHEATPPPVRRGETPAVCVEALDYAHQGFVNNADAMADAKRAVAAASNGDRDGVADATADLDDANDRLEAIASDAGRAARACRAGAK